MALIQMGAIVSDMRGSIAGTTFAKSAAGNYARSRTRPVNPRSPVQSARRTWISYLTRAWADLLTPEERDTWVVYAAQTTWTNAFGQAIEIPPISAFVRTNAIRHIVGYSVQTAAPTAPGHAALPEITASYDVTAQQITLSGVGAPWDSEDPLDCLVLWQGLPVSLGAAAAPKAQRYLGFAKGTAAPPPTLPRVLDAVYVVAATTRQTLHYLRHDPLGRISAKAWYELAEGDA